MKTEPDFTTIMTLEIIVNIENVYNIAQFH